ncbi:MAG TPA: prepilin peptidase [Candidatus Deferrimicrobium sp.]|nr:prepilin peptidase [Candidatus Deferrimicrobium sp.]
MAVWLVLFGLLIGSFLNVVIYRLPRHLSVASGRSVCPRCGSLIKWFHNIPLMSFVFLRGKCAACGGKISARYPLVEALNAVLYLLLYWNFSLSVPFVVFALLSSTLLAIFFIDLDFQIIPDVITLPGMLAGLAVSFLPSGIGIFNSLVGLVVGGGALYVIAVVGDRLFKKESMGGGDIKMAAMLGSFLGWQKAILVLVASSIIGLVVSVAIMAFSAQLRKTRVVPFGPFLAAGGVLAIVYGDKIISFYITQFVLRR